MCKACETCEQWTRFKPDTLMRGYWKTQQVTDWGVCELHGSNDGEPENTTSLAVAKDAEEYDAELWTHRTFGCRQHETTVG